ncbi:MAG TPA: efflux RND transporter periplasmic adaptor subunit [Candidatus Polarisedimenticolaceae bacterium]|nr:efflux RND transporter periplasmic adaptor subunit [Candidatus Polarisedimenticolaceae bacterium]
MWKRHKGKIIGGVILLAVVGLIGSNIYKKKNQATEVSIAKVKVQDVVGKVIANGKIQAENKVDLSALVMGQIVNLVVREGDRVKQGDFLLQIDKNRAAAEEAGSAAAVQASLADLDSAKAAMDQADKDLARAKKNHDAGIIPEADYQRAQSSFDGTKGAYLAAEQRIAQNRAIVNAAHDTVTKSTVRAPISGIVTTLRVKAGEVTVLGTMNNPGTQLMTISDMSTVQAVLMVDETDTPNISVGQKAMLTLDSYPGRKFDGVVTEVGHSPIQRDDPELQGLVATSEAINFKVKVKILEPPDTIRPGFSVTADIITGTKAGVPTIPLAAVVIRDSKKGEKDASGRVKTEEGVYSVAEGKVHFVPIKTGLTGELDIEVESGLKEGEAVISGPFKTLRTIKEGDKVKEMSEEKAKAAETS